MQKLISLSPSVSSQFAELTGKAPPEWFAAHDPVEQKLGSGGGTIHLMHSAWSAESGEASFEDWYGSGRGIIIHAGGQSRRLPAYAAEGKALIPVPVLRWSLGQRIDQALLDFQVPLLEKILAHADPDSRWLVASGDVLIHADRIPERLPAGDVVCLGIWGEPEQAMKHGVFFTPRNNPEELSFMLQKPGLREVREQSRNHYFLLDVGIWLLSTRAMRLLHQRSIANVEESSPTRLEFKEYDLYGAFGPAMGKEPHQEDPEINSLDVSIVPVDNGEFYHFGSGLDLIHSCLRLQNRVIDQRKLSSLNIKAQPSLFVQNSVLGDHLLTSGHEDVWIENSCIPATWNLHAKHLLTGIPQNDWALEVPEGICLDVVPIADESMVWRVYGIQDPFRGLVGDPETCYCGQRLDHWLVSRGLTLADLGIDPGMDIQSAPLFPVFDQSPEPGFIQWLLNGNGDDFKDQFIQAERISAEEITRSANLRRIKTRRTRQLEASLPKLFKNAARSVAYQVDLEDLAHACSATDFDLPALAPDPDQELFRHIRDAMFRSRLNQLRGKPHEADEGKAFAALRTALIDMAKKSPVSPVLHCLEDQIIWGRCPVRLDLAGGWSDTPPYCFMNGGSVVNIAVELNGQPPIQVFARRRRELGIKLRSIDLGVSQEITTYEDLRSYADIGSGFAVPKAALALCGFLPEFRSGNPPSSLESQLKQFGSGIELSLLCAIPKGSGLGTSSILSATLLGVLGEFCQLGWDQYEIGQRVLVLEQMLTSGGGWQDQYGGICRGLKFLETAPGLDQSPKIRWIDDHLFTDPSLQPNILLYYTGITRVAKSVLGDIVRGMFLNDQNRLKVLDAINEHARHMWEILQEGSYDSMTEGVARSWELNKALDPGTSPPEVEAMLEPLWPWIGGCKLLGAGGGGYLLILARDGQSAQRIKEHLIENPPNSRARFVSLSVSREGLQVTRS